MSEKKKDMKKAAIDGYIDYLRRLKDVSECSEINLEKAKKALEKRL